jgi:hypothetical protein
MSKGTDNNPVNPSSTDTITIEKHCQQCGWNWLARQFERPDRCPHCKSLLWDKPLKLSKRDMHILQLASREPEKLADALPPDAQRVLPIRSEKKVTLMETMFIPCGEAEDEDELHRRMGDGNPVELHGRLAEIATPNSFISRAYGQSMTNPDDPDSIHEGDRLLMIPVNEWKGYIEPGMVVYARLRYKTGNVRCTLKTYAGKRLKPLNPKFKGIDFGKDIEEATIFAVCGGVVEKVLV